MTENFNKKIKTDNMKKIFNGITIGTLLMVLVTIGCNKGDEPTPPSAHDVQVGLLAKTWAVKNETNGVSLDGMDEITEWPNFTITLTSDKKYTASGVSAGREVVWPTTGVWEFKSDTELNTIIRDDGVEISFIVDASNLNMNFNYSAASGRLSSTEGAWIFNMQESQ